MDVVIFHSNFQYADILGRSRQQRILNNQMIKQTLPTMIQSSVSVFIDQSNHLKVVFLHCGLKTGRGHMERAAQTVTEDIQTFERKKQSSNKLLSVLKPFPYSLSGALVT